MATQKTLDHFFDASEYGYGQCNYFTLFYKNDQIHYSLVIGKSRMVHFVFCSILDRQSSGLELHEKSNKTFQKFCGSSNADNKGLL